MTDNCPFLDQDTAFVCFCTMVVIADLESSILEGLHDNCCNLGNMCSKEHIGFCHAQEQLVHHQDAKAAIPEGHVPAGAGPFWYLVPRAGPLQWQPDQQQSANLTPA